MTQPDWHAAAATLLQQHGVDAAAGLSDADAATRLAQHGPNRPPEQAGRSAWMRLLDQLVAPLVLVLCTVVNAVGVIGFMSMRKDISPTDEAKPAAGDGR